MPRTSSPTPASEPRWLSPEEQDAWVSVLVMQILLPPVLDAQLKRDSDLNLFEYHVLSSLSVSPERRVHMRRLAQLTESSLSRLSNVVKRLESRGWIRREPDPEDRRSTLATLTDTGMALVVQAAPGHVECVRTYLVDPLTPAQIKALTSIGRRVRERIEADQSPDQLMHPVVGRPSWD